MKNIREFEIEDSDDIIVEPFDPKKVDIAIKTMVIANVVERMEHNEIILDPDFQRSPDLWKVEQQSRLIESLMIRIPLPSFYFSYSNDDDTFSVIDGLQRLCSIKNYVVAKDEESGKFRLQGLEYLKEYEGRYFEDLPNSMQRRIREQEIIAFVVRPGTPEDVQNSIFKRINTGGLVLTDGEIKNAIYRGQAADLLRRCALSKEFRKVTKNKLDNGRMLDREYVNRFMAFFILDVKTEYRENLDAYLELALKRIQKMPQAEIDYLYEVFVSTMQLCYDVFGEIAFRRLQTNDKYGPLNKPLFECVSVSFAKMSSQDRVCLTKNKDCFLRSYNILLRDKVFIDAITQGTAKRDVVEIRHCEMMKVIRKAVANA